MTAWIAMASGLVGLVATAFLAGTAPRLDNAAGASRCRATPVSNPHFAGSDGPANRSLGTPVLLEETGRAD